MSEEPDKLPDGRVVEKVPVVVPPVIAQALNRIAAAELRLKNVANVHEGMLAAQQFGHVARGAANVIRKYAESQPLAPETDAEVALHIANVIEELEIVGALASKLSITIKTHPRMTKEHMTARDEGFAEVIKASSNAGAALRDYLLAVADTEKAKLGNASE